MSDFFLVVSSGGDDRLAQELERQLSLVWPSRTQGWPHVASSDGSAATRGDPVAIAGLVLAIPSAILATLDLAQRAQLAARLRQLTLWAKGKPIRARLPDGREEPLEAADPGEWIDIALDGLAASEKTGREQPR